MDYELDMVAVPYFTRHKSDKAIKRMSKTVLYKRNHARQDKLNSYYANFDLIRILARNARYDYGKSWKLSLTFIMPMPESWSEKKKGEMCGTINQVKPDLSNLIKFVEDAFYSEDSSIAEYGRMRKEWGYKGKIIIHT